ncbi:MAG TPA: ArsR family transcriptional regulator [Anaeromyxobacteraceae bacterium]|nr:ArsR family transcriptional regulator [Anaeromyxobacteraceae bacterium]
MRPLREDAAKAARATRVVKALAHPDRLRIVAMLCEQDATIPDLAARLRLAPSTVARQLVPLLRLGLVAPAGAPGALAYRVAEPTLHGLVACMEECGR